MPVDVRIDDRVERVEMTNGTAKVSLPPGGEPVVDPDTWVLRAAGQ
jgi:hypothetical protein